MENSPLSTGLQSLLLLGLIAASFYFILRPLWRSLGHKRSKLPWRNKDEDEFALDKYGTIALEVVALISLARGFPYGAFGIAAGPMIAGFAVGLAILPKLTRPLIAVVVIMVAVGEGRIPASTTGYLITTVVAYILLKLGLSFFKRG